MYGNNGKKLACEERCSKTANALSSVLRLVAVGSMNGTVEIDDEFALLIDVPKSDPFWEKKKKLLENMGLDPDGPARIKHSITSEHLKDVVNVLLQRARIRSLNEVELYFGEDCTDPGNYRCPRNELEALHSVLGAVNKSLSDSKPALKNVLHNLCVDIIDRIRELGNRFNEETEVIDHSCHKEKLLLDWSISNGVKTNLDVAYVEGAGRGLIACKDLDVGDIALDIPLSAIISEELVHESDMCPILESLDGISAETMLLLWTMKEKHNASSKFNLYFDSLPEKFNTGLSFEINAVMALDGTLLLEEIVQAKEHLRTQYDELFPALCNEYPDVFPPELYTWECFLWACELWYSNSMKVIFGDGKLRTCLIPLAGFLNHSIFPHITQYGRIDPSTNSLKFPLSRPCGSGEHCFLSYGNYSSSHLLTFYGFLPKGDNPYDVIPLDIEASQQEEEARKNEGSISEWSSHMVRGTWLSNNHGLFHYALPTPLLNHLRRARDPEWQTNTVTPEILEMELEVLRDLISTFEGMMESLGNGILDDRETTRWDVKLATDFKSLQRRIVSSILTSCNAGCELLECELHKYSM